MAKTLVVNFYDQLNLDFENNKGVVQRVTNVSGKHQRNKIAGYVTKLMRQIKEGKIQTLESLE